jgi:hypothetical protein
MRTKLDLAKYLAVRVLAFIGLTAISTIVMAVPYAS